MPIKTKHEQAISIICHTSIDSAKSSLECDLKNGGAGYPADALRECLSVEKASGKPRTALIKLIESHISRREKLSHSVSSVPSVVKHSAESESQQLATQLTDQYRKAISGTRDILVFGAMMLQLGGMLNQRGPDRDSDATGPKAKGLGLKGWIEEHCPEINYATAYSFLNLARGLVENLAIPPKVDVARLLSAPEDQLTKHEANIRTKVDEFIAGKSKRQLEFDFSIRKPQAKPVGAPKGNQNALKEGKEKQQQDIDTLVSVVSERLGNALRVIEFDIQQKTIAFFRVDAIRLLESDLRKMADDVHALLDEKMKPVQKPF
jgi:hypothetical protein